MFQSAPTSQVSVWFVLLAMASPILAAVPSTKVTGRRTLANERTPSTNASARTFTVASSGSFTRKTTSMSLVPGRMAADTMTGVGAVLAQAADTAAAWMSEMRIDFMAGWLF